MNPVANVTVDASTILLHPHGPRSNDSHFGPLDTDTDASPPAAAHRRGPAVHPLPFTVRVLNTERDLLRVQALRAAAYGHHLPDWVASFAAPDPIDRLHDTVVLIAEDKRSGELVGTARVQSNLGAPLQIERSLVLPAERQTQVLAEITRLAVMPGYTPPVRLALVKASQLYCLAMQIGGIVAGSRRSLLRSYLALGFGDLYSDERWVPLQHAGGLAHRVLFLDVVRAEAEGRLRNPACHGFVFGSHHPDIQLFAPVLAGVRQGLGGEPADVPQRGWALAA